MEKLPPEFAFIDEKLTEWTERWPYWCWFVPIWLNPLVMYFTSWNQLFGFYFLFTLFVSMVPVWMGQIGQLRWLIFGGIVPMFFFWLMVQVIGPRNQPVQEQIQKEVLQIKSEGGASAPPH